jgi:hypothetical protein
MKKTTKFLLGMCLTGFLFQNSILAQEINIKPRPSTLHKILLESEKFPKKELVLKSYKSQPFPDKYIDFGLSGNSFDPKKIVITEADRAAAGKATGKMAGLAKAAASSASGGMIDSTAGDLQLQIDKYLKDNKVAKQIGAKWLDIQNGQAQLGNYMTTRALDGLSEAEKSNIDMDTYKANILKNDVELMANSFVTINKLFFQENEPVARLVRDLAKAEAAKITIPVAQVKAMQLADTIYEKTKVGYTVLATTYLYQLDWNAEKANLANDYFNNKNIDAAKAFDTTTLFNLIFLGKEVSTSLVTFSLKETRTEDQIIELAVKRSLNNTMSKLQRKYSAFRPIFPLLNANPFTAQIGLKEGVENGDKFDVLKAEPGKIKGTYVWNKVGSLSVDKKTVVWDNDSESTESQAVAEKFTLLSGKGKGLSSNCYIRLAD